MRKYEELNNIHPPNKPRSRLTSLCALLCTALLLATTFSGLINAWVTGTDDGGVGEGDTTLGGLAIKKIAGLVTSALGTIGVVQKVDKAGDAARIMKVVDEATDSAGLTKYVVKYSDEVSGLEKVVGSFDEMAQAQGAVKALQKMGPKADILKNSDALKILGKSDNLQWTKKQITALDEIIRDGGKAGGKFEGLTVDLAKMEKLANTKGFNSLLSRVNSNWDIVKKPWFQKVRQGRINKLNNAMEFVTKYGDEVLEGINSRIYLQGRKYFEADLLYKYGADLKGARELKHVSRGSKYVPDSKQIDKMVKALELASTNKINKAQIFVKFEDATPLNGIEDLAKYADDVGHADDIGIFYQIGNGQIYQAKYVGGQLTTTALPKPEIPL